MCILLFLNGLISFQCYVWESYLTAVSCMGAGMELMGREECWENVLVLFRR
jgi:hypothetical protein